MQEMTNISLFVVSTYPKSWLYCGVIKPDSITAEIDITLEESPPKDFQTNRWNTVHSWVFSQTARMIANCEQGLVPG